MDSKKLNEMIAALSSFLENEFQEEITIIRFIDDFMDGEGIKVDGNLIIQEIDGDLTLERVTEIPATRFDPGDTIYEELCSASSLEEMLPVIKEAIEENQEEREVLALLDYENEIEEDAGDEDDF